MKKKTSLRTTILSAMIFVVAGLAITVGIVLGLTMKNISDTLKDSNDSLNETIGEKSFAYMSDASQTRLLDLAEGKAGVAEEIFSEFERCVLVAASMAERIYENPELYPERPVPVPDKEKNGTLSMQVLYSADTDPEDPAVREELALIGNVQDVLMSINANQSNMASIYVATESGFMVQADYISAMKFDEDGNIMPLEARERPWYVGARETGKPYFTPVTKDAHTPRLAIMCGVPVYGGNGALMGVAGAGMYLDSMENLVESVDLGEDGHALIINRSGQVLFSTFAGGTLAAVADAQDLRNSEDEDLAELVTRATEGLSGVTELSVDDIEGYAAYAPMETVGWSMVVFLSQDSVDTPTKHLLMNVNQVTEKTYLDASAHIRNAVFLLLGLLAVSVIITVLNSVFLSRRIVRPIQTLTEEVGNMEGNKLDFHWDLDTGDETQVLAESFESMTVRMKEYIDDIADITAENERINTELSLAAKIQTNMLPGVFPPFPERKEMDIYASMDAAREVGGDFYDFFLIDEDHLCLVMADVSGKGVPAALFMMASKIILGNYAMLGQSPGEVLENTNNAICATNKDDMFVTVWIGILDLKTGVLTAANAGHEYPAMLEPDGKWELIKDKHGFVIGGMPNIRYKEYTIEMKPGSKLFLYTDGVPEATSHGKNMFGLDRMLEALNINVKASPEEVLRNVRLMVDNFVAGEEQFDDLTMLCVEYNGAQTAGAETCEEQDTEKTGNKEI